MSPQDRHRERSIYPVPARHVVTIKDGCGTVTPSTHSAVRRAQLCGGVKVAAAMFPVPATQLPPSAKYSPRWNLAEPNGICRRNSRTRKRARTHTIYPRPHGSPSSGCRRHPRRNPPEATNRGDRVVGRSDPVANLDKAGRGVGVEVAQLVVGIRPNRAQLIAHADVDGEPWGRPVVVLDESGEVVRVHIPDRIALEDELNLSLRSQGGNSQVKCNWGCKGEAV